ncbi:unnamed protein product [Mesocestoides corti]|uniref:Vesicle transport protein SEC20 n=1 Tax=Mesocestoides corti TaxID=53468 RepID=A0A0R3UPJ8_MESCO|nr:unnamed protein product [Mesocestoides corti]
MSARLVYRQCVDECASIQALVNSILSVNDDRTSVVEKRKRLDTLHSDARRHLSTLKAYINNLEQIRDFGSSPENRKKFNAIENQYASFLDSYRKAVYTATKNLETSERSALLSGSKPVIRDADRFNDLRSQMEASMQLTSEMRVQARRLAEEVARGNANAELVDDSSNQFEANLKGLKEMGGQLKISSHLGGRLSRRRVIDCFIFTLVFAFFYLTCVHIILKRLYVYRLFG